MVCFCSLGHLQEIRNWINEFTLVIGTYLRATRGLDFLNHNIWVQPKKKKHKMTANVKEKKNWITRKKLCNLISFFFFFLLRFQIWIYIWNIMKGFSNFVFLPNAKLWFIWLSFRRRPCPHAPCCWIGT